MIKFKDLNINDQFDFIEDNSIYNSFFKTCQKISNKRYIDSDKIIHVVGTINCQVYHVKTMIK